MYIRAEGQRDRAIPAKQEQGREREGAEAARDEAERARPASASVDRTVRLWDVYTGREPAVLRWHENEVNSVALSPGGTGLASTSEGFGAEV